MTTRLPKLLEIYDDCMSEEGHSLILAAARVASWYTPSTLSRMLASQVVPIRQGAVWGLGLVGDERQLDLLGPLLRDALRGIRMAADEARRSIMARTQSPWHRRCEASVEDLLAMSEMSRASKLADQLVEETERRSDAYLLRAWVRFCSQQLDSATDDCKKTLAIDPYCYRACMALGQCYWHQNRDAAARECFYESVRLYPDWEPGYTALRTMHSSRSVA
jgi:tetratricopeptide (TPR) repeat protein